MTGLFQGTLLFFLLAADVLVNYRPRLALAAAAALNVDTFAQILVLTLAAGTPLVFAALGELIAEKSGVLNLGVEGMMLVGAIASFIVAARTQSPWLGVGAGALAAAALSLVFAFIALTLRANQVATGLALSLFGIGLSAFVGRPYMSVVIEGIKPLAPPGIVDLPVVGTLLFGQNPLVYVAIALFVAVHLMLYRTRAGLVLRAVGEAPHSARAIGYPVIAIRYLAVLFGGACAGLGGAFLAVAYTPIVGRRHDGRTRLDCAGARRIRELEAVARDDWRVSVRQRHARAIPGAGGRRGRAVATARDAAVSGDDRRPRGHVARRDDDPAQCPRVARKGVRPGVEGPALPGGCCDKPRSCACALSKSSPIPRRCELSTLRLSPKS